jgi:hypothetical protein
MAIQVTDEILTIVATDPIIVEAGREALRAVNARAAAAARSEDGETAGEGSSGEEDAGEKSTTATVIRGDLPAAAGLADVWLQLRKTLNTLADPSARARQVKIAVKPPGSPESAGPTEERKPDEP